MGTTTCIAAVIDVRAVCQLESGLDPFKKNGDHHGLCQLSSGVLADYNKAKGSPWKTVDLYNGVLNFKIARWYLNVEIPRLLRHHGIKDTTARRLTAYRLGIEAVVRGEVATGYIKAYYKLRREDGSTR